MSGARAKSEPRSSAGKTCTYDQIRAGILSHGVGSSKHSKKLYKLTRQLTRIKNHLVENNDQTYLLDSVEEVITIITSYRDKTKELPFDWTKEKFLLERYRGAKLVFPPGKSFAELGVTAPKIIYETYDDEDNDEDDDEDDDEDHAQGSLRHPNSSRLRRPDPVISEPLMDHSPKALAVSYLSCLESICKTIDDLSKRKIKRSRDIYMGLGGSEVFIAGGELVKLEECYGLTKKGLRSRLKEDRKRYLQSYSIQKTNSGPKEASSSKGKAKSWRY